MLDSQLRAAGITDEDVIAAILAVPRELFVSSRESAPRVQEPHELAQLLEALQVRRTSRVLEVGTGSGYAAAVLSRLVGEVLTVDANPEAAEGARERLAMFGYARVRVGIGTVDIGWPEYAPFDRILVSTGEVPGQALHDQLAPGGRLVSA